MLTMNKRAFVLNEMGTGKTRSLLYAFDFLRKTKEATRMLIVAPLSTLTPTWEREIFMYFPGLKAAVLHGPKAKRLKLLGEPHDVYIINHDGVNVIKDELLKRTDIDCICIDELAVFRKATTRRYKALRQVVNCPSRTWVWGMTGAPTPNEPADAWAQVKLLSPSRVPKFFKQFRERTMMQVSQFKWVPRKEANRMVHEVMQPSVRFTRDQCLDLPPTLGITHTVTLDSVQLATYKLLEDKLRVDFAQGKVTAANEGVLMNKLLQISCGYVYHDQKGHVSFNNAPRLKVLQEIIEECERKVLVFVPFIHAVDGVVEHLRQAGIATAKVYGETSKRDRDIIFSKFQRDADPKVIVAHPKTMAHGLTLTAANTIVWYAPHQSLEEYEQANARIVRPGQTSNTLIVHIEGTPVDRQIFARLVRKQRTQGALLAMFQGVQEAA